MLWLWLWYSCAVELGKGVLGFDRYTIAYCNHRIILYFFPSIRKKTTFVVFVCDLSSPPLYVCFPISFNGLFGRSYNLKLDSRDIALPPPVTRRMILIFSSVES